MKEHVVTIQEPDRSSIKSSVADSIGQPSKLTLRHMLRYMINVSASVTFLDSQRSILRQGWVEAEPLAKIT